MPALFDLLDNYEHWGPEGYEIAQPDGSTRHLTDITGDKAIDFLRAPHEHKIWDLGTAWHELTALPFVFAVWALRRGHHDDALRDKLRTAKSNGLTHLTETIATYPDYDADFRQSYLGGHIQYDLGKEEKSGLEKFVELLKTHGEQEVFAPLFV